jgi:uncharacterized membrane protein YkoI
MSTKNRTNRILIGVAAGIGVLAGAAGISAAVTDDGSDPRPTLAREEAEAAAVEEVPGSVVGIEADDDDATGGAVWSVEVEGDDGSRHEVDVADDGSVVGRDVEDDDRGDDDGDDDGDDAPVDPAEATVSQADAEAAALAEVPGTVRSSHLEREDGGLEWDVDVTADDGTRHDLQIDAETGQILEHDTDD